MQRLQLDADEEITRKEYLKRKKKNAKILKKRSKITYLMIAIFTILVIYILVQFYLYKKKNNFVYTSGEEVDAQKIYNVYYVTEGYTYDPVYSLNKIHSDGFEEETIYQNSGLADIIVTKDYVYGIKQKGIYRLNRTTNEFEVIVESNVAKYTLYDDTVYYITLEDSKLKSIHVVTKETKDFDVSVASEILVDQNYVFVVQDEQTKKILFRFDKSGENKTQISNGDYNVSYIIQDATTLYYVNKEDENKIYCSKKDGSNEQKLADIKSVSDKGSIREVDGAKYMFVHDSYLYYINPEDGNTLWRINLDSKEQEKVISVAVEILQYIDNTIFYKIKNEMGVYLYNYDTKFMSQVTKRKVKEFFIDQYTTIEGRQANIEEKNNKR